MRGRPDIYRIFTLTGSIDDVDIGDPDSVQPSVGVLERSLVKQSLLRTRGTARQRGSGH